MKTTGERLIPPSFPQRPYVATYLGRKLVEAEGEVKDAPTTTFLDGEDFFRFTRGTYVDQNARLATRARRAIQKGFMEWARAAFAIESGHPEELDYNYSLLDAFKKAWEITGLEMVYEEGATPNGHVFTLTHVDGEDVELTGVGPTLPSLVEAVRAQRLFALMNFGPGSEQVMVEYLNTSLALHEPLQSTPKNQAMQLGLKYSADVGFHRRIA